LACLAGLLAIRPCGVGGSHVRAARCDASLFTGSVALLTIDHARRDAGAIGGVDDHILDTSPRVAREAVIAGAAHTTAAIVTALGVTASRLARRLCALAFGAEEAIFSAAAGATTAIITTYRVTAGRLTRDVSALTCHAREAIAALTAGASTTIIATRCVSTGRLTGGVFAVTSIKGQGLTVQARIADPVTQPIR